jgi:hypothetical protein
MFERILESFAAAIGTHFIFVAMTENAHLFEIMCIFSQSNSKDASSCEEAFKAILILL